MAYNRKDYYFFKAKEEHYVARSIFKLREINDRRKLFKKGDHVLDLGAAPGSWSQYLSEVLGPKGKVLGIDLDPVRVSLPNAIFVQANLYDIDSDKVFNESNIHPPFDAVISDMAPRTTGIRVTDQTRSLELCELALMWALKYLKPKGHFICKLFHSEDFQAFKKKLTDHFDEVDVIRPKSTRKESTEIFFVAMRKKAPKTKPELDNKA